MAKGSKHAGFSAKADESLPVHRVDVHANGAWIAI
jgi:hypothetical protein